MNRKELDIDMLANVTGGSIESETAELKAAILKNPHLSDLWNRCMADPMNEGDDWWICADVLYQVWDICTGTGRDCNIYEYGDYTHAQILDMIRKYK
ncbi:MAG: hypothetical protein E7386_02955 [Ruminococcaceae bacterium]|nr:hypothetical protein [Oscillospiraceae bacterium]